eukprot:224864_1
MHCTIRYAQRKCTISLPFDGSDVSFEVLLSKRFGLRSSDKYYICDNDYDPNNSDPHITSHHQLKPNHTYKILYICQEVKKVQHMSRARKLYRMKRKTSAVLGAKVPSFSRKIAFTSGKSWVDLLRKSSQLVIALKA